MDMKQHHRAHNSGDSRAAGKIPPDTLKSSPDGEPPLVLVADDDPDTREVCTTFLTWSGFRVVVARDGLEAVTCAREKSPNVVLMDLAMPRMDGWAAIQQLKSDERTKQIPIIAFTARGIGAGTRERARAFGCDGFLAKPCLPEAIELEIRLVLWGRSPDRVPRPPKGTVPPCPHCSGTLGSHGSLGVNGVRTDYYACPMCGAEFSFNEEAGILLELPNTNRE